MGRLIACVYCGDGHADASAVRECWQRSQSPTAASAPAAVAAVTTLAADQQAAVTEESHTVRIIAPAGSGKTRVLTERARHLVQHRGIASHQIALIAYNKRAQGEMAARTADIPGLHVRTLNAIALAIVNGSSPFAQRNDRRVTIDEPDVRRILHRLVTFPKKRNADPVAPWIDALSATRLGMVDPSIVERRYGGDVPGLGDVLRRYRAELARQRVADFDEQIVLAVEALQSEPDTLASARKACTFLLVDEFQDLTPAHLTLVRLLAGDAAAVYAVGDDDQTIYGYNGADPSWLIDFANYFPGAVEHALTINYRCPADVVDAADRLLRHNRRRVPKSIGAGSTRTGLEVHPPDADTVARTVSIVSDAVRAGHDPSTLAIVTRVNSLLAPVQAALSDAGVPSTGGVGKEFIERTSVRASLAWLRLATAERLNADDLSEALRRPSRSLHPRIADWVKEQTSVEALQRLAGRVTNDRDAARIGEFASDIERVRAAAAASRGAGAGRVLQLVRDGIGLGSSVAGLDSQRHGMNRAAQSDDLTALVQLAALHPDSATFERWLATTLAKPWAAHGVTLATVHRVKGLEWPTVVVHHVAADQFPHRLSDNVEEERRVFHVAITRGIDHVHVVPAMVPSPFVAELHTEPSADAAPLTQPARTAPPSSRPGHDLDVDQRAVFEGLRELRRHLAAGKPAYTVFADSVLDEIARRQPDTLAELGTIKGVGPSKLNQYGEAVLTAVRAIRGSAAGDV